jgi:hypothetical protein
MGSAVIFKAKDISRCNSVWRLKEMKKEWEGEWKNERVYIEADKPPIVKSIVNSFFSGLFGGAVGVAKIKFLLQYGTQIVDRCEIDEALDAVYELYGRGMQPDGQEVYFHAWITSKITGEECELEINNEKVRIRAIE